MTLQDLKEELERLPQSALSAAVTMRGTVFSEAEGGAPSKAIEFDIQPRRVFYEHGEVVITLD